MANDQQSTPQWLFDDLASRFHFRLDAAADHTNFKCPDYYGPGGIVDDALSVDWPTDRAIWLNPPYSRGNQRRFVEKAIQTAERGGRVIALLPADTGTKLFHELIWKRFVVEFIPGRLKFNGVKGSPRFASMVVDFDLTQQAKVVSFS